MRRLLFGVVICATMGGTVALADRYKVPDGCTPIATLRLAQCVVAHFSRCEGGTIEEQFIDGRFVARMTYTHPALFVRFQGADGRVIGHAYGEGAPEPGDVLEPGDRFAYERRVYRTVGEPDIGDEGTEVLEVGQPMEIELDGRRLRVLDLRFEVTNPETGYQYRERSLMLMDPPLTLGTIGAVVGGEEDESFSTLPESVSLDGEPGFLSMQPGESCGEGI